jgi:hypothetical protein
VHQGGLQWGSGGGCQQAHLLRALT